MDNSIWNRVLHRCKSYLVYMVGLLFLVLAIGGCATLIEEDGRTTLLGYGKVKSKTGAEGEIKVIPTEIIVR